MNKKELYEIFYEGENKLSVMQLNSKLGCISRGLPWYGILKLLYPKHMISFKAMHDRVKIHKLDVSFSRDVNGFIDFILYLGPVPSDMIDPTVGRIDHSLGYIKNILLESKTDKRAVTVSKTD